MKINLFLVVWAWILSAAATAQVMYHPQNKPTAAEKALDTQVQPCITEGSALAKDFKFSEWTGILHYYNRKMIQRLSAEMVEDIAAQRPQVEALVSLSATCAALQKVQGELQALKKVYDKKIKEDKANGEVSVFGGQKDKVSMDKGDAEEIIKQLDKLRKKLGITSVIVRL